MRVYGNNVAVNLEFAQPINETSSGLMIVDTKKVYERKGEVIGVGPGRILDDGSRSGIDVKVGSTVYLNKYGLVKNANTFFIDGVWIAFVHPREILTEVRA